MRTTILFCVFFALSLSLQAQLVKKGSSIGVTFSGLGNNDAFYRERLDGAGGYTGKDYYSLGITYLRPLSNKFDLETGVEYSKYIYSFSNSSLLGFVPRNAYLSLIEIPVTARFDFWKYFFLNGGLLLDFDITKNKDLNNQTGIGTMLGVGLKYDFKNTPIGLFVNPYIKYRPFIPLTNAIYHLRTMESGYRMGVVYNF